MSHLWNFFASIILHCEYRSFAPTFSLRHKTSPPVSAAIIP